MLSRASLPDVSARALSDGRGRYIAYFHEGSMNNQPKARFTVDNTARKDSVLLALPAGEYRVTWFDPKTGERRRHSTIRVQGETAAVASPLYVEDLVLEIRRR
jgi:hypothetical protein